MGNIVTKNGVIDFSNFVAPDQPKIVPVDTTPVQHEPVPEPEPAPLPEPIPEQVEDPEVGIDPEPQIGKTKSKK